MSDLRLLHTVFCKQRNERTLPCASDAHDSNIHLIVSKKLSSDSPTSNPWPGPCVPHFRLGFTCRYLCSGPADDPRCPMSDGFPRHSRGWDKEFRCDNGGEKA